jgi:membrane-bound inhibitor of C-type lysozyme
MENLGKGRREIVFIAIVVIVVIAIYFLNQMSQNKTLSDTTAMMFICDDTKSITALYRSDDNTRVNLRLSHSPQVSLSQAISASGARYASADESLTFWSKGKEATITENGKITYSDCQMLEFSE